MGGGAGMKQNYLADKPVASQPLVLQSLTSILENYVLEVDENYNFDNNIPSACINGTQSDQENETKKIY